MITRTHTDTDLDMGGAATAPDRHDLLGGAPINPPHATVSARPQTLLLALLVAVSIAFAAVLVPFLSPILWALIVTLVFAPVFRRMLRLTRHQRTLAALLTLASAVVLVVIPLSLLAFAMTREANGVFERVQSGELNPARYLRQVFNALPEWVGAVLDRFGLTSYTTIERRFNASVSQGVQSMGLVAFDFGQDMFDFVAKLFITLYLVFFMMRDGERVAWLLRDALPLHLAHKQALFRTFATVLRATVKGHLVVAAIQGALGGLAFWALGIKAVLLWAVLMALLSLLPVVGSGLVWLPMALYLIASGSPVKGVLLIAFGVLVIGLIDNLLQPLLVGRDTQLPDYLVMVATLGGLASFGINGLVLGPAIAALFMAVWKIHLAMREDRVPI